MNQLVSFATGCQLPAPIAAAGERSTYRFLEFFTADQEFEHPPRLAPVFEGTAGGWGNL